jgi:hypothetical protein
MRVRPLVCVIVLQDQFEMSRAIFEWIFGLGGKGNYELIYLVAETPASSNDTVWSATKSSEEQNSRLESIQSLAKTHQSFSEVWALLHDSEQR